MALLGSLIARSLKLRTQFTLPTAAPRTYQRHVLRGLLDRGQYTAFGKHYGFADILSREVDFLQAYRSRVPLHDYDAIHQAWWHRALAGEENVAWPGQVKYFALSSGTSGAPSKHIPVTADMIKAIRRMGFKQLYSMSAFNVRPEAFGRGILMLGGTTSLDKVGDTYVGDMSGISARNIPRWALSLLYKPGQKISKSRHWDERIAQIVERAPQWDVGTVCGVPAWVQIVFEQIIRRHGLTTIHDIWPNLSVYIHGGVAFGPYREAFGKLLGKPVQFIETYMASEGTFGFQARPGAGIRLVLNNSIFYEFIPFTPETFDDDGVLIGQPATLLIDEVEEGVDYAVVLSTCAGAWRYMIGDVVRFTSAAHGEIQVTGRTKQFLSICGEHTSIDNMTEAIAEVQQSLGITIREFAVTALPHEGRFAHRWAIGCDADCAPAADIRAHLDTTLRRINDDYDTQRESALTDVFVDIYPTAVFYDFLRAQGKHGGMSKFPRVLKGNQREAWETFLKTQNVQPLSSV